MSEAKKCDRCGNYYDGYGKNKQADSIGKFNSQVITRSDCDKRYDVCPACMKEFERWLKNEN